MEGVKIASNADVEPTLESASNNTSEHGIATLPNFITLIRFSCIPVFVWLLFGADARYAAAWVLSALGATDWIDGFLARRFHQVSTLGKIIDPVVDRVLIGTAVVCALIDGFAPRWFTILVILREVLVTIAVLSLAAAGAKRVDVQWVGKAGTFALMFAFPLFLGSTAHMTDFWHSIVRVSAYVCAVPGLFLAWYAAATYVPLARKALRDGRLGRGFLARTTTPQEIQE